MLVMLLWVAFRMPGKSQSLYRPSSYPEVNEREKRSLYLAPSIRVSLLLLRQLTVALSTDGGMVR